ncbi:restriction endonuclease subunit S [Periweissella cryptocerci]|uniref:Restriction endonuclease subunit S n=1 Tax=Periweissella cryptocerci TaxID=2506420 RepID=A0A4P6YSZ1_9LACO|nr:restriction endonuclease subunit S [Periweissella cryptocerci]QBO35780.1 restriction endonuclease subunit S [Periweissella cryptocerci]
MTTVQFNDVIDVNPKETIKKGALSKKLPMDGVETFTKYIKAYEITKFTGGVKFRNGDTLMARITPSLENGKTAYVDTLHQGEVAVGSTEFLVFRPKKDIILNEYIYYLATTPEFRDLAIKSMTGTSGRQRVQTDLLLGYEFNLPSLDTQRKIITLLDGMDSKIKLNKGINDNLAA